MKILRGNPSLPEIKTFSNTTSPLLSLLSIKVGKGGGRWQGNGNNDPLPHLKVKKPPASQLLSRSSEK